MAAYGRDYREEHGFGYRSRPRELGHWGWPAMPEDRQARGSFGGYDAPLRGPGPLSRGYGAGDRYGYRYGADFQRDAYDREYKSRWQTDQGDPYGDRIRQTPMRVFREDEGFGGTGRYGRDFDRYPYPVSGRNFSGRRDYDEPFGARRGQRPYEGTNWTW